VQLKADPQETLNRSLAEVPGLGLGMIDQAVPFHNSDNVPWAVPTLMHSFAVGQETLFRALFTLELVSGLAI
jgi:hypothetical protein